MAVRVMHAALAACLLLGSLLVLAPGCGAPGEGKKRKGIITLGPHLTETVFALGQGHRVIAVDDFSDYPPGAWQLPKIGGYLDPNLEKITMLSPELMIVSGESPKLSAHAEANGIPTINVHMDDLATIRLGIERLGTVLKCQRAARKLAAEIEAGLEEVRNAVKDYERSRVLIITTRESHDLNNLYTVGGQSFVSEMVNAAGGENLYGSADQAYLEASKETVVMEAPDTILEFHCGRALTRSQKDEYFRDWLPLSTLPAVKNGRIFLITDSHGLRPGPRVVDIARQVACLLHPEVQFVLR